MAKKNTTNRYIKYNMNKYNTDKYNNIKKMWNRIKLRDKTVIISRYSKCSMIEDNEN